MKKTIYKIIFILLSVFITYGFRTSINTIPYAPKYQFKSLGKKILRGTSGEKKSKGWGCTGIIKEEDKFDRLALVSLFYQNGCYLKGKYANGNYPVEKGIVTNNTTLKKYEAYKIYSPKHKASKFFASQHVIYYKFSKKENYNIYSFDGESIKKVYSIQASDINLNEFIKLNISVSHIQNFKIFLFIEANKKIGGYKSLSKKVDAIQLEGTDLFDIFKYRYSIKGQIFDTRRDYNYGPNTYQNRYSRRKSFFFVKNNDTLGVIWQDQKNYKIYVSWMYDSLKNIKTIHLKNIQKYILAAATCDKKGNLYYLSVLKGESKYRSRTVYLFKSNSKGKLIKKRKISAKKKSPGLNMVKFNKNVASMSFSNHQIALIIARSMHKSADGLNHQGAIAVIFDDASLKIKKYWGQTSGHSFENILTVNSKGEFLAIDLGDNYPRGIHLHKFTDAKKISRVVYTFKTRHGSKPYSPARKRYPFYKKISHHGKRFYKWSNDNDTYTELGGVIEASQGYTIPFIGEPYKGNGIDNSRTGKMLNDPRNIGLVQVKFDFKKTSWNSSNVITDDLILTEGKAEESGFYTFNGKWSKQRNKGIVWLTNYQNKNKENASRLKSVLLPDKNILLIWEKWTKDNYVSTHALKINEKGKKLSKIFHLSSHIRLNRIDDIFVQKNKIYLAIGNKPAKKLELIVIQLK